MAQVGFPYCESFQGGSAQSATVVGGSAQVSEGVLRLTDAAEDQSGYIYVDIPFPSAFGIKASFDYYMYGGSGADGITVFLFDANIDNFSPGGFGGSLGYSPRNNEPGLTGGYLGLGFDAFGNFGNTTEGRIGGFGGNSNNLFPDAIVLRGPAQGGYAFVTGIQTNDPGPFSLPPNQNFPVSSGEGINVRVTDPNQVGYRKVFVDMEPNPGGEGYLVSVDMIVTTEQGNPRDVSIFSRVLFEFPAPENLKIGFAASTGGLTNIHEIANLQVEVSDQEGLQNPVGVDIDDKASCAGQDNTYEITSEDISLLNEGSVIRCLQLYGSLEEIEEEADDVCAQGRCRPENREMVLPQGTFRAADEGGSFTFFPNEDFIDETVEIYYTVTDNFGKTSEGNFIRLLIQESPEPVRLSAEGVEAETVELRQCEGDGILLTATGDEDYFAFEWYLEGEKIPGADQESFFAIESGQYQVIALNEKSCPAESNIFELINPELPALEVDQLIVGCSPGMSKDIREFIEGYDLDNFDYLLEDEFGNFWKNDEMNSISQSGKYQLSYKFKDLECYSGPIEIELIIVEEGLIAGFDYEVDGTGIKTEEDGGIFIDDPIRFIDLSSEDAISWEWDFGDGAASDLQSPVHVFGQRGNFKVKLTVTNELGCQSEKIIEVPLTLSYRVMIPSGFTPNQMENRFFRPKVKGIVKMELLIFNLWGNTVFQSNDLETDGWDGRVNGELAPSGNYVYRVKMESVDGELIEESGRFTLIR
ncbi:PKD domain-containing protein [Mongoliibacter sp.]|uniref:PKD domain-containing protein n=1 Tax=Mongoliibacter sp. TaxID=2022438 RepID=UPI0025DE6545|nr:PKD domain-containing protein [Mongoliibacter sp.]